MSQVGSKTADVNHNWCSGFFLPWLSCQSWKCKQLWDNESLRKLFLIETIREPSHQAPMLRPEELSGHFLLSLKHFYCPLPFSLRVVENCPKRPAARCNLRSADHRLPRRPARRPALLSRLPSPQWATHRSLTPWELVRWKSIPLFKLRDKLKIST